MADLLKRSLAPVTAAAWEEIDDTASQVLKAQLSARSIVDFDGPHGWEYAAVNLGTLEIAKRNAPGGVPWGSREVRPLVEVRMGFTLSQLELDNVSRGSSTPDLGPLEDVCRKVAQFEDTAIYKGFDAGHIQGIIAGVDHKPVKLAAGLKDIPNSVTQGVHELKLAGVGGPYALVLGTDAHKALMQSGSGGYPPHRIVRDVLEGGDIIWSPVLSGGILVSTRGGDFELVMGQDLAIGYSSHDRDNVELFLTESFTFRVLEPAAGIELKAATR